VKDEACYRLGYLHSILNRWKKLDRLKYIYMSSFSSDPNAFEIEMVINKFER
jgi:hypothetical protein